MKANWIFILIFALLSPPGSAGEKCTGKPQPYVWKRTSLKADENKSALVLAHDPIGNAIGYEIADISGQIGELFKAMQLEKGDILVAIDGVDIDSPFQAVPRFAAAKSKRTFCLVYLHLGERLLKFYQRAG